MVATGALDERAVAERLYGAARAAWLDHTEATATIKSGLQSGVRRHA